MNIILNKLFDKKENTFWFFLAMIVLLTAAMMISYYPLCPGQDFFFHYQRFQALMEGLQSSPFLIYLDYQAFDGYGYFTKAFYPDVILIPFAFIGNLTSAEFGWQSMIFTMTVLCGIFTYKASYRLLENPYAAMAGALLYTFCIYRLLDIYHRAALGEALSFTFVPLVIWGLYEIIYGNRKKWYILAIGFSLMIFTHVISSVLVFVTVLVLLVFHIRPLLREPDRIYCLLIAGAVTLLLTAYYLFPMAEQMLSNTFYYEGKSVMAKAEDSTLGLHWIIWGMFSGIIHPKQIFVPGTGLLLTCVIALRIFVRGKSDKLKLADTFTIIGFIYILATSPVIPWSVFPFRLLNFIQLPWRLYEFSSLFFAIAGAYYLALLLESNKRRIVALTMIVAAIAIVIANDSKLYKDIRCYAAIDEVPATVKNDYHMGGMEYLPERVPSAEYIFSRKDSIGYIHPDTKATAFLREKGIGTFKLSSSKPEQLELPLIYYKGYKATLDGQDIPVGQSENGLINIEPQKQGEIQVYYAGTIAQRISLIVSLFGILGLCIYIYISKRRTSNLTKE
ncbi:YfhO family protein [Dysgonomonas sp. 511]|uniref:YfhO family protein n=1 Tax=Dysgonomonas sp. 511 TaxID=2302930 RepID=UPI0013CF65B9|nr:YfhO family protein [Dysgonomonas sp. 511]NDV78366.1 hypothetical protein [Dysgonomonas sp. 511]